MFLKHPCFALWVLMPSPLIVIQILAVGPGSEDEPMTLKVGEKVMYASYSGVELEVHAAAWIDPLPPKYSIIPESTSQIM